METMFFQPVRLKWSLFALCGLLTAMSVHATTTTTTLAANGGASTYTLIESVLGNGTASETPDCAHSAFGPHITQSWDSTLGKYVFNFFIHVTPDNDRCIATVTDRQRNEIKTMSGSPSALVAYQGDITSYRWFFKLDSGFQPSKNFTHIHQIKADNDGLDDSMPLITIAPRAGSPEKLEILYAPPIEFGGDQAAVTSAPLSGFKGQWIEANERMLNASNGTYQIVLKRVSDGAVLLSYTNNNIIMWRGGGASAINRPKWGIYRSLSSSNYLRDEVVKFADFSLTKGDETPPLITTSPTNLTVTAGQNASFAVAAAGIAPLYYQWRFNTTNNLAGATNATMILTNAQSMNAGSYAAVVSNPYGSVTSTVATLTVVDATYILTVNGGSGDGSYTNGTQVAISADAPAIGKVFSRWTGDTQVVADVSSSDTTVTMPAQASALTATYIDATYLLTINSGTGGGLYTNGQQVAVAADAAPRGYIFDQWTGDTPFVASVSSASTTVTMQPLDIALTATYRNNTYTLAVSAGANGRISPANAGVWAGDSTNFVITASNYYRIASLTTNGVAVTGMSFDNGSTSTHFIWSNVQTSGVLAATFTAQVATNDPAGTPYSWLAGYGLTNYNTEATNDVDLDGLPAWQEYIAGTVPTNKASCFKATQNNRNVITWNSVSGRIYSVYWSTNLVKGFQPLKTNIFYPTNSYTNATPDPRVNHYQIKVRMQ